MKILKDEEEKKALEWLNKAVEVAKQSLCQRAHYGSIIEKDGAELSEGFNSPPQNDEHYRTCANEYEIPTGFRHDRTCCIHAEQRAIQNGYKAGKDLRGAKIYLVTVDEAGNKVPTADLKCTICSRAVLDAGIKEFVYYFADGVRSYDPEEVHKLSFEYKTPRKN
ncbi:MAG TPA: hypothetical protein VMC43_00915 [Candidatus Paceibacterota bacterium]|nr:hypothetical protein [Candidatus Paceibacterota bacterium]